MKVKEIFISPYWLPY